MIRIGLNFDIKSLESHQLQNLITLNLFSLHHHHQNQFLTGFQIHLIHLTTPTPSLSPLKSSLILFSSTSSFHHLSQLPSPSNFHQLLSISYSLLRSRSSFISTQSISQTALQAWANQDLTSPSTHNPSSLSSFTWFGFDRVGDLLLMMDFQLSLVRLTKWEDEEDLTSNVIIIWWDHQWFGFQYTAFQTNKQPNSGPWNLQSSLLEIQSVHLVGWVLLPCG